ncbi:MAG: NAD-dependent epimerase/dehydratase family protein [Cyanobacteria bacterium SZAS TMP-1]|nr:NAD-dependent epimerase/dehydratase family protein [Cyanobacteria bacterium SZAS TMP-1]
MTGSEKIFVTGASGFIGLHLVRRLLSLGHQVTAMSTKASPALAEIAADYPALRCVQADLVKIEDSALDSLMAGSDVVYHLAGLVSYQSRDIEKQRELNVGGTQKIAAACHRLKVRRLIYTSSIAAMGVPHRDGDLADESLDYNLKGLGLGYCDSKQEAEVVVSGYATRGLDAVILCPGIIFGEGDNHAHHFRIFSSMSKGGSLCVPRGGIPFSDINDVIDAHISALTRGRGGERYCLVSANRTFRQAAEAFASIYGGRLPLFEYPVALTLAAGVFSDFVLYPLGFKNALTRQQAYLANKKIFFASDKAVAELGFRPTPFEETIKRTAPYYLAGRR